MNDLPRQGVILTGHGEEILAKIAVELQEALARRTLTGGPGFISGRVLAQGAGWVVEDVICTSGPQDRPFEEQHENVAIAMVVAGTFQYRSSAGQALMTPGSLLLGNAGQCFECGHEHVAGDRCISFRFSPDYFQDMAAAAVRSDRQLSFRLLRVPPVRALSGWFARACAGLTARREVSWEELGVQLAVVTLHLNRGEGPDNHRVPHGAEARVSRVVRRIERELGTELTLSGLAREAGLSPYHFLRTFEQLTGVTPHQFLLRARLRAAALRVATEPARIIDIAFACGFGDLSNFNRAFRTEFGVSPRTYRRT